MSKFGEKRTKKIKKPIHSAFSEIDYVVGEKEIPLQISIEETIVLETDEDESTYSEGEAEYQLEKTSFYRKVVYEAYVVQRRWKKKLQREAKIWYANAEKTAETVIVREKKEQGFSQSALKDMITSTKLTTHILSDPELSIHYNNLHSEIDEAEEIELALKELADIIRDRSMILMVILKRRREE